MIAILNGVEGGTLDVFKGADALIQLTALSDGTAGPTGQVARIGTPLDVTGDTVSLEIYDAVTRVNTVSLSVAAALVTVAAGQGTFSITATASAALLAGKVYYGFVKRAENTGTTVEFSRKYVTITTK